MAMGGTLQPQIQDLPGRMDHRSPKDGTVEERFAHRHTVRMIAGNSTLFGTEDFLVNSLHGQGLGVVGERINVEGHAPDGTIEALSIKDAPGFALAVQWHPEYNVAHDPASKSLFTAFGAALRAYSPCAK